MGVRGRKSAGDLMMMGSPVDIVERQKAPHDLTDEETEVWAAIVAAEPADWFTISTRPILGQYCRHVVAARRVAELIERAGSDKNTSVADYDRLLGMQERESRTLTILATKMRLTQQSITNHRGSRKMGTGTLAKKPWE